MHAGARCYNIVLYHAYSIWLFTYSDIKTIIAPSTAFAVLNSLGGVEGRINQEVLARLSYRAVIACFWVWINLLPFAINNQRQPSATAEDRINKPWRTMPSRRMTETQAWRLMLLFYAVAIIASYLLDALRQCLILIIIGTWYNDFGGADVSSTVRNFINACGFVCFTSGALQVMLQADPFADDALNRWFVIISLVVFSTVQTQDMYDQEGDSARGRKTTPLVIGDGAARWSIAVPMGVWCGVCPWFWESAWIGYAVSCPLALIVVGRTLVRRSVREDKVTFRLWNLWLVSVYSLRLVNKIWLG